MPAFRQKAKLSKGKQITLQAPHPCEVRVTQVAAHTFIVEADEWTPPRKGLVVPTDEGRLVRPA